MGQRFPAIHLPAEKEGKSANAEVGKSIGNDHSHIDVRIDFPGS
jgi:hypothetical protein